MKKFTTLHFIAICIMVLILDQWLKIYIKTNFNLGEEIMIIESWFRIHFVENPGMAFGMTFGDFGKTSKVALTIIRIIIIVVGVLIMLRTIRLGHYFWNLVAWSFVLAGAIGNLIDSIFYGLVFNESGTFYRPSLATFMPESGGYAGIFQGKVVDMFYFPIIDTTIPSWFPFWSNEKFVFFAPIFNIADSCITTGIITIIILTNFVYKKKVK